MIGVLKGYSGIILGVLKLRSFEYFARIGVFFYDGVELEYFARIKSRREKMRGGLRDSAISIFKNKALLFF